MYCVAQDAHLQEPLSHNVAPAGAGGSGVGQSMSHGEWPTLGPFGGAMAQQCQRAMAHLACGQATEPQPAPLPAPMLCGPKGGAAVVAGMVELAPLRAQ